MKMTIKRLIFSFVAILTAIAATAASVSSKKLDVLPFPEGHGLAGAYIGALDATTAIIAGGSDFETLRPWEGGTKSFFGDIYILRAGVSGYECVPAAASLPEAMGNGCGVVSGDALYCLGGLTSSGYSSMVVRISLSGQDCAVEVVGRMPEGFRANAAASWNGSIYVAGTVAGRNAMYRLQPGSMQWTALSACPERLLEEGSTLTPQNNGSEDALYLIGGRGTDGDGLFIATNVWEYLPQSDSWVKKAAFTDRGRPVELMYTASLPYGSSQILSFGCDDGVEFRRRIALMAQGDRQEELTAAFKEHPGFSDRIWAYDAVTDRWKVLDTASFPLPAVTTAVMLGGKILLPSGEEHPGVRNSYLIELGIRSCRFLSRKKGEGR